MKQKTVKTKITVHERTVLAAVLGGTNLGMSRPERRAVQQLLSRDSSTVESCTYALWSGYMESDEMEEAFVNECKWWFRSRGNLNNAKVTREYVTQVWPDVAELVWGVTS